MPINSNHYPPPPTPPARRQEVHKKDKHRLHNCKWDWSCQMQTTVSSTVKKSKNTRVAFSWKGLVNEIRLSRMNLLLLHNHTSAWCVSCFIYSKGNKEVAEWWCREGRSGSGRIMSFLKKSMNSMKTQRHPGCRMIMALQSIHNWFHI